MSDNIVLVKWKVKGALIVNGRAYARKAGEQDLMPLKEAKPLIACKMLEIIGDVNSIPTVSYVTAGEKKGEN